MNGEGRLAVGVMSGTSIDGLDAALVRIEGRGLEISASLVHCASETLGELAPKCRAIAEQKPTTAEEMATVAWDFGLLHVQLIKNLLAEASREPRADSRQPDLICVHGQTVYHKPPISFQLINPAPITARWPKARLISDLRQEDLARGGEGAPITPLADWIMFRDPDHTRAIINLGGFCNVTILPKSAPQRVAASPRRTTQHHATSTIAGFDVCPCNHLLDAIARERLGVPYDRDGKFSLRGEWFAPLRKSLQTSHHDRRSLGTGDEDIAFLREFAELSAEDLLASVCFAIADNIRNAVGDADQLILAGGGALNAALVAAIKQVFDQCEVITSDALGVPVQTREAMAMAILGILRADGIAITLPQITGRQ